MKFKIIEYVRTVREFEVEAEGEMEAIDKFSHDTTKLLTERESCDYEVMEINEVKEK